MSKIKSIIIIVIVLIMSLAMTGCGRVFRDHSTLTISSASGGDEEYIVYDGIVLSDEAKEYIEDCENSGEKVSIDVVQYLSEKES